MKRKLTLEKLENRILLNSGGLDVRSFLGGIGGIELEISLESNVADYFVSREDHQAPNTPFGCCAVFSYVDDVSGNPISNVDLDRRSIDYEGSFNLGLFYNGSIYEKESYLEVKFPYPDYTFGTKPITFEKDNGQRYDVRQVIAEGEIAPDVGKIPLENVPAGTYESEVPYATATINFKKTADLNNDGSVDAVDLALMSENWLNDKSKGDYVLGDISGSEGKPDGVVNLHDFAEFSRQYKSE